MRTVLAALGTAGNGSCDGFLIAAIDQRLAACSHVQLLRVIVQLARAESSTPGALRALGTNAPTPAAMKTVRVWKRSCRGADLPAPVVKGLQGLYCWEDGGLPAWARSAFPAVAPAPGPCRRNAGNVVDGLVRVELAALAAHMGQGIDQMGLNALQAELEGLKQTRRTCANDDGVGFHGGL
jgi:hypothetical protein